MWTALNENANLAAKPSRAELAAFGVRLLLGWAAVLWACWPSIERMQSSWQHLPQYSHGYLVPVFAGIVLWFRRKDLMEESLAPSGWGLVAIGLGLALKFVGTSYFYDYIDDAALVPLLWGVSLIAGGLNGWIWSWQAILMLLFMIPLPFRLETALQQTLLHVATAASTYLLQTFGYSAFAEGNIIHLPKSDLGVIDACSGMRMSIVCTALAALVAILSSAPAALRIVVLLSGMPVAVLVNLVRICVMGAAMEGYGKETADEYFHDALGYLMMPLALALLALEYGIGCWIYELPEGKDELREPMYVGQAVSV